MKTLSKILEAAAQVRAEKQESENTAERVGGVLCDLTDFLQNKTALTGINLRTNANGVSIEVRAQTGDGQEASTVLVFPEATETQAGIITSELLRTLRAGINSNSDTIQNLDTVLQDCVSKITAAQASIKENSNNVKKLQADSIIHYNRLDQHGKNIENNQALLREHRTDIADAKAAISAAQASILENANDIAAAETAISAAQKEVNELRYRMQGREDKSENCSAYTYPFIFLGDFSGWDVFSSKLKSGDLMVQKYMGRCRARVDGVTVEMYQFINSFSQNDYTQVILGNVSADENGDVKFTPNNFNIIHRQYKDGVWTAWQRINSHPIATPSSDGFMSAQDKGKLDAYPAQFVLDLGTMPTEKEGDAKAASSEVAGNRNISFIRFQTQGVNNLKTTLILQYTNGVNDTAQIKFVDKAQWRRNVTGATGVKGAATTATQWERTAPHYLGYDAANRKIQLKDYTQTVSREVQLPLVSASSAGLLSPDMLSILNEMLEKLDRYAYDFEGNPNADSGNISGNPRDGLMSSQDKAKLENYPASPFDISEVTEQQNGLMTSADKKKLDAYPSDPLKIPLATASTAGLLSYADYQKIQWLISERDRLSNAINDIDARLRALENK